jgi:hypothetical protein
MATIVNTPATDRVVDRSDNGGWAVAVIVLLAVVVIGAFVWMRYYNAPAAPQSNTPGSAQINLTLPSSGSSDNSGSQGSTGGANTGASDSAGGAAAPVTQ